MSERDKSFTVSDRRHFTPDGCPRSDEAEAPVAPRGEGSPAPGPLPPPGPADFSGFLLTLAAQAGMLLSQPAEGPEGGPGALEEARSVISILEMLKDKTEGRRTAPEDALLDDVLFQLRLAYVEKTRTGAA